MDEQYADILQTCLAQLEAGATIEECLSAFPQQRSALEGPLRTAVQLRTQPWPGMPATAQATVTAQLATQLTTLRTSQGAPPLATAAPTTRFSRDPGALLEQLIRALGYQGQLPQLWLRPAAMILAVLLALALGLGAAAAAQAILRTILSPSTSTRAPAVAQESFTLNGAIHIIGATEWVVEDVPVIVDAQTTIDGVPVVGASAAIQGVIQEDGTLRARAITVSGAAPPPSAAAATQVPSAVPMPTVAPAEPTPPAAPTQPLPTQAPPPASPAPPAVAGDPFVALRALIDTGVSDGRAQREGGIFLLEKLDQAQSAVAEGKANQLRDRLRDMQQKVREQVREGTMDPGFGQQVLDGVAVIANTYRIQLSEGGDVKDGDKGNDDEKGRGDGKEGDDKGDDKGKGD